MYCDNDKEVVINPMNGAPYSVHLDAEEDKTKTTKVWDQDRIRIVQQVAKKALRFDVGQRVECYVGGRGECRWMSGTIIKT